MIGPGRILRLRASERDTLARFVGVYFAAFGAYYLVWRAGWSLNLDALWLAIPLLVAEAAGFLDFLLFLFMTWRVPAPRSIEPLPGRTVDVFITTYNEDPEILRSTILGAVHMRYPHRTYVLDDGRRPDVARLAQELGAEYITRPDATHAKAGNINHALAQTSGEFVAIFDADHVPHPQFLERTLGYLAEDARLALVQTPQEFYNLDSIQHGAGASRGVMWHEQSLFYRVIQPGKNRLNSVFWCGSGAVLRRSALEDIGGVATETVTEDLHTTIRFHKRGWRTAYHDETLAAGIAPDDLESFLTQRRRWAQGAMQILRSRDNPLWTRGLSLRQRASYWASMSTYFSSFQKVVLLVTPIVVLSTGILPMDAFGWDFLLHFAPYMILGQAANGMLGRGHTRYLETERFNLLKTFAFVRASAALVVPRELRFKVTRKTRLEDRSREFTGAVPHMLLLISTAGAIIWAARTIYLDEMGSTHQFALMLTAIWAVYNAGMVGGAVRAVLTRAHRRSQYRFAAQVPVRCEPLDAAAGPAFDAWTTNLSPDGLGFQHRSSLPTGLQLRVRIDLPGGRPIRSTAIVMNASSTDREHSRACRIGAAFTEISDDDRDALRMFLFSDIAMGRSGPRELRAAA